MSALEFVAAVVGLFFVIGVGVGVIAIMAMAAIRHDHDRKDSGNEPPLAIESVSDDEGDDRPQWPDGGYGG